MNGTTDGTIEELEGIAHRLKGENMALAKANERLQDKLDIAEACIEEVTYWKDAVQKNTDEYEEIIEGLEAEVAVRTANNVEYLARIKSMGLQNRINLEEITALEFELRG